MQSTDEQENCNSQEPGDLLPPNNVSQLFKPKTKGTLAMKPMKGFTWNPLRTLPRNSLCPCLSGQKFKKCCLNKLPLVVAEKVAEDFKEQMKKPDLVFMTKDNQEKIKAKAEALAANGKDS